MAAAERAITWNLSPAPKVMLATNPDVDGIDFREFAIEGDGSFDYGCSVLQVVVAVDDSALSVRSPNCPDFTKSRGKGSSRICLPGDRVKGEWRGAASFRGVYLGPDFVERTFEQPFRVEEFLSGEISSPIVEHLLNAIGADVVQGSPSGSAFIQSVIVSLLHHLHLSSGQRSLVSKGGLSRRQLKTLQELIDAELASRLSLDRLSREVGVSAGYLSRAFKVSKGVSPHQYILRTRVERAKKMIRDSGLPLDEIAERVGFADGSHMTTVFLKQTQKPPSQFRNR
jgi:AraC family transcriptional regulator